MTSNEHYHARCRLPALTIVVTALVFLSALPIDMQPLAAQQTPSDGSVENVCPTGYWGETGCYQEPTITVRYGSEDCWSFGPAVALSTDRTTCVVTASAEPYLWCGAGTARVTGAPPCVSLPIRVVTSPPRVCQGAPGGPAGAAATWSENCIGPAHRRAALGERRVDLPVGYTTSAGLDPIVVSVCRVSQTPEDGACISSGPTFVQIIDTELPRGFAPCPEGFATDDALGCARTLADGTTIGATRTESLRSLIDDCPLNLPIGHSCFEFGSEVARVGPIEAVFPPDRIPKCPGLYQLRAEHSFGDGDELVCSRALETVFTGSWCRVGQLRGSSCVVAPAVRGEVSATYECAHGTYDVDRHLCLLEPRTLTAVCPPMFVLDGDTCLPAGPNACADVCVVGAPDALRNARSTLSCNDEFAQLEGERCVASRVDAGSSGVCASYIVTVNLALGEQPTDGDDVILGTAGDDEIAAGDGDDVICASGGNDTVWGQGGSDVIEGGDGDDVLRGGVGDDFIAGGDGNDDINGGRGDDAVYGEAGDDLALRGGTGNDFVSGGSGSDQLVAGNGGIDTLIGGDGDDHLSGGPRGDYLLDRFGSNVMRGNGGNDTLIGRPESELFGGPGIDDLQFGGICNGGTTGARPDGIVPAELDHTTNCSTEINVP